MTTLLESGSARGFFLLQFFLSTVASSMLRLVRLDQREISVQSVGFLSFKKKIVFVFMNWINMEFKESDLIGLQRLGF